MGSRAKNREIKISELAEQKMILMEKNAPYSIQFEQEITRQHLNCEPVFRMQSTSTACRLASCGPFVSVLPFYAVRTAVDQGLIRILSVPQWNHQQTIPFVLHRSKALTPQIEGILEELYAEMRPIVAGQH